MLPNNFTIESLKDRCDVDPETGCWVWRMHCCADGYGRVKSHGRQWQAHRLMWHIVTGEEPPCVCHKCDNPPCINPLHLFEGTQADNIHDSQIKGRFTRGERVNRAKLNTEAVRMIRWIHEQGILTTKEICKAVGVSRSAVYAALNRTAWIHVP